MGTQSTPKPAATGGTPNDDSQLESTDLTGGTPPVPITVWRTARTPDDTPGVIGARLAARIVSAYSQSGEQVIDLTDGHALAAACHTGGRRHHAAEFTDTTLTLAPATTPEPTPETEPAVPTGSGEEGDGLDDWFGDDLTEPLPPYTGTPQPDGGGRAGLVVANWPLHPEPAGNQELLAGLLAGCVRLLRPGGCLVLVVGAGDLITPAPQDFTPLVRAAAAEDLGYLQHIVAVTAATGGDRFTYYATTDDLIDLADTATGGGHRWYLHLRVNSDLLVFLNTPAGDARA